MDSANYFFNQNGEALLSNNWRFAEDEKAQSAYKNLIDSVTATSSAARFLTLQREIARKNKEPATAKSPLHRAEIAEESKVLNKKLNTMAAVQIIQSFYDMYIGPVKSDVTYRLGEVVAEWPAGKAEDGITDKDGRISTRSNFSIKFNSKIARRATVDNVSNSYTNLFFPPYTIPNTVEVANAQGSYSIWTGDKDNVKSISLGDWLANREALNISAETSTKGFYNKNTGKYWKTLDLALMKSAREGFTYRSPSFKSINDNIHFIQYLFEGITGIASTYLTEWDISLYIQEGLVTNSYGLVPNYISLVNRLTEDNPMGYTDYKATSFGVLNCAVSKLFKTNQETWNPSTYPLAHYWTPYPDWRTYGNLSDHIVSSSVNTEYVDKAVPITIPAYKRQENEYGEPVGSFILDRNGEKIRDYANDFNGYEIYFPVYYKYSNFSTNNNYNEYSVNGTLRNRILRDDFEGAALSGYQDFRFTESYKAIYTTEDDGLSDIDTETLGYEAGLYKKENLINNIMDILYGVNYSMTADVKFGDGSVRTCAGDVNVSNISDSSDGLNFGAGSMDRFGDTATSGSSKWTPGSVIKGALTFLKMFMKKKSSRENTIAQANAIKDSTKKETTYDDGTGNGEKNTVKSPDAVEDLLGLDEDVVDNTKTTGIPQHNPVLFGGPHGYYYSPRSVNALYEENNVFWRNNALLPIVDTSKNNITPKSTGPEKWSYSKTLTGNETFTDTSFSNSLSKLTDGVYSYIYEKVSETERIDTWFDAQTLYDTYYTISPNYFYCNGNLVSWLHREQWVYEYNLLSRWWYLYNAGYYENDDKYVKRSTEWMNGPEGLGWYQVVKRKQVAGWYLADVIKYKQVPMLHSFPNDRWCITKIKKNNYCSEPTKESGLVQYVSDVFKWIIYFSWGLVLDLPKYVEPIKAVAKEYSSDCYKLTIPGPCSNPCYNNGYNLGNSDKEIEFMDKMISSITNDDSDSNQVIFFQQNYFGGPVNSILRAQCKISTQNCTYTVQIKHSKSCNKTYYTSETRSTPIRFIEVDFNNPTLFLPYLSKDFSKVNNNGSNILKLNEPTELLENIHPVELLTSNGGDSIYYNESTGSSAYSSFGCRGTGLIGSLRGFYPSNIKNRSSIIKFPDDSFNLPLYKAGMNSLKMSYFLRVEAPKMRIHISNINNQLCIRADNVPSGAALSVNLRAKGYAKRGNAVSESKTIEKITFFNVTDRAQYLNLNTLATFLIPVKESRSYDSYTSGYNKYDSYHSSYYQPAPSFRGSTDTYDTYESDKSYTVLKPALPSESHWEFTLQEGDVVFSDTNRDFSPDNDDYGPVTLDNNIITIPEYSSRDVSVAVENLNYRPEILNSEIRQKLARAYTRCTFYKDNQANKSAGENQVVTGDNRKCYWSTLDNGARNLYNSLQSQRDFYVFAKELFAGDKSKGLVPQITPTAIKEFIYGNKETKGLISKRTLFLSDNKKTTMPDPEGSGLTVNKQDYYGYNQWIYEMLRIFNDYPTDSILIQALTDAFDQVITTYDSFINRLYNGSNVNLITKRAEEYSFNEIVELLTVNRECRDFVYNPTIRINNRIENNFIAKYIYSYLNVLYESRKYFINKRCNKQDGTLWACRHLEAMIPMVIGDIAEANSDIDLSKLGTSHIPYTVAMYSIQNSGKDKLKAITDGIALDKDRIKQVYIKVNWATKEDYEKDLALYNSGEIKEHNIVKVPVWEWVRDSDGSLILTNGKYEKRYTGQYKYAIKPMNYSYFLSSDEYTKYKDTIAYNKNIIETTGSQDNLLPVSDEIDYAEWYISWGLPNAENYTEAGKTDIMFDVDKSMDPEKMAELLSAGITDPKAFICGGFDKNAYWVVDVGCQLPRAIGYRTNVKIKPVVRDDEDLQETLKNSSGDYGIFAYSVYPIIADQKSVYPNVNDLTTAYSNFINK